MIKNLLNSGFVGWTVFVVLFLSATFGIKAMFDGCGGKDRSQWEKFAAEHACKRVGEISGSTQTGLGFGVATNGQMGPVMTIGSTSKKTGWLCDDGVTYWR